MGLLETDPVGKELLDYPEWIIECAEEISEYIDSTSNHVEEIAEIIERSFEYGKAS